MSMIILILINFDILPEIIRVILFIITVIVTFITVILTIVSLIDYLVKNKDVMKDVKS